MLNDETVQLPGRLNEFISFLTPSCDTHLWNAACIDVWIHVHHFTTRHHYYCWLQHSPLSCQICHCVRLRLPTQTDRMKETSIQLAMPKLRHSMFYVTACIKIENPIIRFGMMQIIVNRAECVYGLILYWLAWQDVRWNICMMYYQYVL